MTAFISVVIPAFNEECTIAGVVKGAQRALKSLALRYEVFVIDDGSNDNTAVNAASTGAHVIHNARRSRQGSALRNGFRYVNGDIVVILDGDGQHNPSEIPKLLEPVLSRRADLVIGSRYLDSNFSGFGVARRLSEIILTRIIRAIVGLPLADTQSGFRCITANALAALDLTAGYSITVEMLIRARRAGLRIIELPIHVKQRHQGKPKTSEILYFVYVLGTILNAFCRKERYLGHDPMEMRVADST